MKKIGIVASIFFYCTISSIAQENKDKLKLELEQFKQSANADFNKFRNDRDKEFADLIKKGWTSFETKKGKEPLSIPKPPVQPTKLPEPPKQSDSIYIPTIHPLVIDSLKELETPSIPINNEILSLSEKIAFKFYNLDLVIHFDKKMNFHCNEINENGVSDYWKYLSGTNYTLLIDQIKTIGKSLKLNDWGYFELVSGLSKNLLTNENDQALFIFFMMNHIGFDAKVAKQSKGFILLLPFETTVYKKSFIMIEEKRYYIINDNQSGSIYTFKQNFSNSNRKINLNLPFSTRLGNNYLTKELYLKKLDTTISIKYNHNLINFYNEFPMTDLSIFFNASIDPITEISLTKALAPLVADKNELEAVNIILDFVQNSFEYKTDLSQFGYEKFFFPEDMFYYPYSDCEDRAVLFSHLVKSLLKLDVIGLEYTTHAACAVKFNSNINGDFILYHDEKYLICDPTYINAAAGMSMPQFINEKPIIISSN